MWINSKSGPRCLEPVIPTGRSDEKPRILSLQINSRLTILDLRSTWLTAILTVTGFMLQVTR